MSDICFDIMNIRLAADYSIRTGNKVKESVNDFKELLPLLENEQMSFIDHGKKTVRAIRDGIREIGSLMTSVEKRSANAQSKKQQEKKIPPQPQLSSNATADQKKAVMAAYQSEVSRIEGQNALIRAENQRIDEYVSKCISAQKELEELLYELRALERSAVSDIDSINSAVSEQVVGVRSAYAPCPRISDAIGAFSTALDRTLDDAQKLYMLKPSAVKRIAYVDKQFEIKNTHSHLSVPNGALSRNLDDPSTYRTEAVQKTSADHGEILIKDKDKTSFLENLKNASRIKMPSSNLHKLGGKAFMAEMQNSGYVTVVQSDGSVIDGNGMIHWEKKDG